MTISMNSLIEHLKGPTPYGKTETYRLWEALNFLSENIGKIDSALKSQSSSNVVETPTGIIDGSNKIFRLSNAPTNNFIAGFQNGLLIKKDTDFRVSNNIVIMTVAP